MRLAMPNAASAATSKETMTMESPTFELGVYTFGNTPVPPTAATALPRK